MNHADNLTAWADESDDITDLDQQRIGELLAAADHIKQLEQLIRALDIETMDVDMSGSSYARGAGRLTGEQWGLVLDIGWGTDWGEGTDPRRRPRRT